MDKVSNAIDCTLIALGTTFSLANIQSLLGIIMLAVQLIWILVKLIVKIVETIKKRGNLGELDGDVKDLVDKIGELQKQLPHTSEEDPNVEQPNE